MPDRPTVLVIASVENRESELLVALQTQLKLVFAANADQVIEITSNNEPLNLMLVDIGGMDDAAYETCMWLKTDQETKDVPILVIGDSEEDFNRWLSAGVLDYIRVSTPPELALVRIKSQLQLKYKTDLLTDIASLDGLTAVANKHRLEEYLDIEWRRSLREFYPLSLIKLDIDLFAPFNDHNGIGMGDEALRRIAKELQNNCLRAADMVSRYGPDEFIVLLPAIELESALMLAEKMVNAVQNLGIPHQLSKIAEQLTVSAGVVMIEPSRDKRYQDAFDELDEMLNRAQQKGGNQAQGIAI